MKIISEKMIPLPKVAKLLEEESKVRELSSVEIITLEYAKKFSKMSLEDAEKLLEELTAMSIPIEVAIQITNVVPETEGELRAILAPLSKIFSSDDIKSILAKIKEYKK
ncbi:MAG: hypothetical protein NZ954_06295 [Thermofilaceae archaeon]|nr:hypothetical protein [Thermofilaceae archaeon]MCX8180688.1 hypothetical protein [Thermofilaceae archaeon]MDW8003792.1 hypothetical protein [Thermofilaceae archaeon]